MFFRRKIFRILLLVGFLWAAGALPGAGLIWANQLLPEQLAEREAMEDYLRTAEIVESKQPWDEQEAVTNPWHLTLEKDGVRREAVWKNPLGRIKGFQESWKWEIAAYRLDKYLGLGMVPVTVERNFQNQPGSLQLFMRHRMTFREKKRDRIKTPPAQIFRWNRALYLQRAFDNLIANVDRHQRNYLITEDWRMILIDHSRTFRTSKKYTKSLIYDEHFSEGPFLMKEIPKSFFDKLSSLDKKSLNEIVGEYLSLKEIEAVLKRRDLIVAWIENRCQIMGREKVLYLKNPGEGIN
jgi:hypothetical protein